MTASNSIPPLPSFAVGDELPPRAVTAHNASAESDNKIHDDEVARKYGFAGGLVPGVTVYAYMAGPLAAVLGERWLTSGEATVTFVNPLYEGQRAVSGATVTAIDETPAEERLSLDVRAENPAGQRCGTGTAAAGGPTLTVEIPDFVLVDPGPPPTPRPELLLETAPVGRPLARLVKATTPEAAKDYALSVFDANPLFCEGSSWGPPLMHPGWLLSECNRIFTQSFSFGPWIHTRSQVRYLGPALAGRTFTFHGRMTDAYERRLHHYAVLDIFCVDDRGQPVMQERHTAIFKVHPKN